MSEPDLYGEIIRLSEAQGRISEAQTRTQSDVTEIKEMLRPIVAERQQRAGMVKAAGIGREVVTVLISIAAGLGVNLAFFQDWPKH